MVHLKHLNIFVKKYFRECSISSGFAVNFYFSTHSLTQHEKDNKNKSEILTC